MFSIPCFYFPTTVMLVDDNLAMLHNLSVYLHADTLFKIYCSPYTALAHLEKLSRRLPLNHDFLQSGADDEDDFFIKINFSAIIQWLFMPDRYAHITTIVVDQVMPVLSGLDFCRKAQAYPQKKIMLTGEAGPLTAISAFNEGLIDQFIVKASYDMYHHLMTSIAAAQKNYFLKQSENIYTAIVASDSPSALFEPDFQALFQAYLKKKFICEYYLIGPSGSFFLMDEEGKQSWLIVKNEQEMENDFILAKDYSQSAPLAVEILQVLKHKTCLVFLYTEAQKKLPISAWADYLHEVQSLQGRQHRFYYAIVENDKRYGYSPTKIESYRKHLNAQ